ncbi:hypothetical protein LCGC14_1699920 [marine sediment metagenome]|uniref:Uncharacterized protein n=1 Tax=marine sediment metagenome TaxID=412755 RepID=A0A0F9HI14_9ZZZZ
MRCLYCEESLRFVTSTGHDDAPRGWVHMEGGVYMMGCTACGWSGAPWPSPSACPRCGNMKQLRDLHCVIPKAS